MIMGFTLKKKKKKKELGREHMELVEIHQTLCPIRNYLGLNLY